MQAALIKLLCLRLRGQLRRLKQGLRSVRGGIFFAFGVLMMLTWMAPGVLVYFSGGANGEGAALLGAFSRSPQEARTFIPFMLLAFCSMNFMTTKREKSLYFSPAEVDMLFAAPFTRRQLLAYKLSVSAMTAISAAFFMSIAFLRYAPLWTAALVGFFLAIWFMDLFKSAVVLIGQTLAEHAYTRWRRVLLMGLFAAATLAIWPTLVSDEPRDFTTFIADFQNSKTGTCLLAPFRVFARTITAESIFPELLMWGSAAAAINFSIVALVMLLDANYMESAAAVSRKVHSRVQQIRQGGIAWRMPIRSGLRLPMLPSLGGVGPIAWRQFTNVVRRASGLLFIFTILAGAGLLISINVKTQGNVVMAVLIANLVLLSIVLGRMLPFDFRGDLDNLDWLKSLPIRSSAVTLGQLLAPTLVMSSFHFLLLFELTYTTNQLSAGFMALGLLSLPFNFLLFAMENFIFLLFPSRTSAGGSADFQFYGRMMVEMTIKFFFLMIACSLAVAAGLLAYLFIFESWALFAGTAGLVLTCQAIATIPVVAWAFRRFDISLDTPPD